MIRFALQSERLVLLPLVNHFIQRIGLEDALDRHVPSDHAAQFPMLAPWGCCCVPSSSSGSPFTANRRLCTASPAACLELANKRCSMSATIGPDVLWIGC